MSTTLSSKATGTIRETLDSWHRAVLAGDVPAITSHYSDDVLAFDAIAQLQFKGLPAYRDHWTACMSMCSGMIFEIHDLKITSAEDIGFATYLCLCGGTDESGEQKTSWMRVTACFQKIAGEWKIVHEHYSAPFDPMSGEALLALQP
jgi:ketosteroid isomerase-like protein